MYIITPVEFVLYEQARPVEFGWNFRFGSWKSRSAYCIEGEICLQREIDNSTAAWKSTFKIELQSFRGQENRYRILLVAVSYSKAVENLCRCISLTDISRPGPGSTIKWPFWSKWHSKTRLCFAFPENMSTSVPSACSWLLRHMVCSSKEREGEREIYFAEQSRYYSGAYSFAQRANA